MNSSLPRLPASIILTNGKGRYVLYLTIYNISISRPNLTDHILKYIDTGLQSRYVAMLEDPKEFLRLRRTLSLLNEILKEFSTIKLLGGVKVMSNVSGCLLDYFTIAKGFTDRRTTPHSSL